MKRGTVRLAHENESRNAHQSVTLLEAIEEFRFDALIGGALALAAGVGLVVAGRRRRSREHRDDDVQDGTR